MRGWHIAGGLLAGSWCLGFLAAMVAPHWLRPMVSLVTGALSTAAWAVGAIMASRFIGVSLRREKVLRTLIAEGASASLGALLSVLDAELTSRPGWLRPHLSADLERAREIVAPRVADAWPESAGAVRRWLFGPAPPGPFPTYAQDLVGIAERGSEPDALPLLCDLRDSAAHVAATSADLVIRERAGEIIERLLGHRSVEADGSQACTDRVRSLLARLSSRHQVQQALAEQELRAMGPEAVERLTGLPYKRRWWWSLPGMILLVGGAAWLYLLLRGVPGFGWQPQWAWWLTHGPFAGLSARWPVLVRFAQYLWFAQVLVLLSTGVGVVTGWSEVGVRRLLRRMIHAVSVIEGPEAVAAVLDLLQVLAKREKDSIAVLPQRARAARRLCALRPEVASELLVPHGGWFFRKPPAITGAECSDALLAVVRHTWDPAARGLLRAWSRDKSCPIREEAAAALAELDERIARQGTLVRPATAAPDQLLLRPVAPGKPSADNLVRPVEGAGVDDGSLAAEPTNELPDPVAARPLSAAEPAYQKAVTD